jgi:hypothetical protein
MVQTHRKDRLAAGVDSFNDSTEDNNQLPSSMVETVINFLVRISLFTADHKVCLILFSEKFVVCCITNLAKGFVGTTTQSAMRRFVGKCAASVGPSAAHLETHVS